jgi:hypothetical protein
VLIVANELARGVGRESRLAGAGEAEEDGRFIVRTDIRRAVHGEDILLRQQEVEHGEDRFLDFARILGSADQHETKAEVDHYKHRGVRAVHFRIRMEVGCIDHGELRDVLRQLVPVGLNEYIAGKQVVPCGFGYDSDGQTVSGIGSSKAVLHEQIFALQVGQQTAMKKVELIWFQWTVHFSPPDFVDAGWFTHNKLVIGRAAGMLARAHDQRAEMRQAPLSPPDGLFYQRGSG